MCLQDQLFAASEITEETNHRRSAFVSPDRGPLGEIIGQDIQILRIHKRSKVLEGDHVPARNVELIYANLGGGELLSNSYQKQKIEISMDSLSQVSEMVLFLHHGSPFKEDHQDGIPVVISSAVLWDVHGGFLTLKGASTNFLS